MNTETAIPLETRIVDTLREHGDPGAAMAWLQVLEDLAGELRVAVVSASEANAARWRRDLPEVPGICWVPVSEDGLGAEARVLGCHALVFLTPITAPLGQQEREMLDRLESAAPRSRCVHLADEALLQRLSDEPDTERASVVARVDGLLSDAWPALDHAGLDGWLRSRLEDTSLRGARQHSVARHLLREQIGRAQQAVEGLDKARSVVAEQLQASDEDLAELQREARRWTAHTLAILKRQTAQLSLDLADHLQTVETQLPEQLASVEDIALLRKTLPHWLSHVVERWLEDRLATWRSEVLAELEELELPDRLQARLIVPALQPAYVRGETKWAQRLGTTAAFGGAAALLALGLWIPSLLAVAGGIAWSTAQRGSSEAEERRTLLLSSREALRQMGRDAERLLGDQMERLEDELRALAEIGDDDHAAARSQLEAEGRVLEEQLEGWKQRISALERVVEETA